MRSPDRRPVVFVVLFGVGVLSYPAAAGSAPQDSCTAILDGSKFPELVPDAAVWDMVAEEVTSGRFQGRARALGLSAAAIDRVSGAFSGGGAPIQGPAANLARRDALARSLPLADYGILIEWVEERRAQMRFEFPVPGKLGPVAPDGTRRCAMEVSGRQHPHLIPESYYWEAYFRAQVDAVGAYKTSAGRVAPIYLKTHQRYHLPMPVEDIQIFFDVAERTMQQVDRLPSIRQRARVVREAREELVRRLPESSWRVVLADATTRARNATIYSFPTGL